MTVDAGAAVQGDANAGSAGASPANGTGAGALDWLPGVDGDTAKFISDATIKDLPSLAKTFMEQKRTLSQPRAFEMPKEGDAEGLKKLHAALGVPETPDKYDFGEVGKAMKPEEAKAWAAELHKLGIPNKTAAGLVQAVAVKAQAAKTADDAAVQARIDDGAGKLKAEWGDSYDKNYDLANRGWVAVATRAGWTKEMMEAVERLPGGTRAVHQLGLILGQHTVEAGFVHSDGQHKGMTQSGAQGRLQEMMRDKDIAEALVNRNHPKHEIYLKEKQELGRIAHGG